MESIPKIIHYCWFGGNPIPEELQKCIESWSILDSYQVMKWDESNCSFNENEYIRKAFAEKKPSFMSDYYRIKALYEYGGIYFDTDVKVCKSFDALLQYPAFLNFIFDCSVGSAIVGAKPANPFIKAILDMYNATTFCDNNIKKTFQYNQEKLYVQKFETNNYYFTYYILKNYPDFVLNNKFQDMGDFVIFPKEYFEIGTLTNKHYALHLCAGDWRLKTDDKHTLKNRFKKILSKYPFIFDKLQIVIRKRRYNKLNKEIPFYEYYLAQKEKRQTPEL